MNGDAWSCPDNSYRGVTLWMLNDRLDREELKRQLREIHHKGIGAVICRTFMGLRTKYLSDEWMEHMRAVVDLAGELGMEVFLQAGFMPSGIPDLAPDDAQASLSALSPEEDPRPGTRQLAKDNAFRYVESVNPHALDLFNGEAVDRYLKRAYEDTWLARFHDQFGKTITSVWVDEPHFNPPHLPWGEVLKETFHRTWGYRVDETIPSLFRQGGEGQTVRHHYWRTVTDLLLHGYFERVSRWCERHGVCFSGHLMGEDSLPAQIAYTGACMPMYGKMHIPGIDHLTMSLTWSHGYRSGKGEGLRFVLTPKQCSSVAHQVGQTRILAEMYGVSSEGITFEDRKQIADWFFLHGINYRCLHGSFYSIKGRRKRLYVPHLSYQQPWWEDNRLIADYAGRVSYALQQGRFCADVLLLHPVESAYCRFDPTKVRFGQEGAGQEALADMNKAFCRLSECLMSIHRGFDYGDEHILSTRGSVTDGRLTVGAMAYRVVILPDLITLRKRTVDLLLSFLDQGGTVLSAGALPTCMEGETSDRMTDLTARCTPVALEATALSRALRKACRPRFTLESNTGDARHVFLHERSLEDGGILLFLANTHRNETVDVTLHMDGTAGVTEMAAHDGSRRTLAVTRAEPLSVALRFAPLESRLLLFDPAETPLVDSTPPRTRDVTARIASWSVKRNGPNALTLDMCKLKKGAGSYGETLPVSALQDLLTCHEPYAGPITMLFEFEVERLPSSLSLVLEDPDGTTLTVNGHAVDARSGSASFVDRTFQAVEITPWVWTGSNRIELHTCFTPLPEPTFGLGRLFEVMEGTELECVILTGDFAVRCNRRKEERAENDRYPPGFVVVAEPDTVSGDLVGEGYPFFAGEIELRGSFDLDDAGDAVTLGLPGMEACTAEVIVNGKSAGRIAWKPHEVDLSGLVQPGVNHVTVKLKNTLRNLLGPHHRPGVERQQNWGNGFAGEYCEETNTRHPGWWKDRTRDTEAWTEDVLFVRFGLYQPAVVTVSKRLED